MALAPCHAFFQFMWRTASSPASSTSAVATYFGLPFNIASYALLTHMMGSSATRGGGLVWTGGDVHLLLQPHVEQTGAVALSREPRPLPQLVIKRKPDSIFDYRFEHF